MAEPSSLDPFSIWRDLVSEVEKNTNRLVTEATKSDEFNQGMGKAMTASLFAKKASDELAMRYLTAMNMPSRGDIEALGERLLAIEDRLIAMSAAIEQFSGVRVSTGAALPIAAPKRTRKPPEEAAGVPSSKAAVVPASAPVARKKAKGRR